jgi:hypothetical protein
MPMSAPNAKVLVALALVLAGAAAGARADCGGANVCCSEPADSTYICRRVTVTALTVTRGALTRAPAGYQPGDVAVTFTASQANPANFCVLESSNTLRLKRRDTNFDDRFALLLAAKTTGQVVDFSADASPGSACTVGNILER